MVWLNQNKGNITITAIAVIIGVFTGLLLYNMDNRAEAVIGGQGNLGSEPSNPHNLSTNGPGPIKAISETQICVFCHTPHHAIQNAALLNAPLWNHTLSTASYTLAITNLINSTTMPAREVDGASRLCMSCHDGTVGVGETVTHGIIEMEGSCLDSNYRMTDACTGYLGTNLPNKHVFSVPMNQVMIDDSIVNCLAEITTTRLKYPWASTATASENDDVLLRPTAQLYRSTAGVTNSDASPSIPASVSGKYKEGYNYGVQCSTCHDPHLYHEDAFSNSCVFLVGSSCVGDTSALCTACHSPGCD